MLVKQRIHETLEMQGFYIATVDQTVSETDLISWSIRRTQWKVSLNVEKRLNYSCSRIESLSKYSFAV